MVVPFVYTEEEYKKLEERVKFLEEENNNLKNELMEDMKTETKLNEEIKKLKSDLAYERTMLDNVKAEYECSQDVIGEQEERIRFLEQCLDNKEKVNKSMREELEWYHGFDNYLTNHGFDMKNLKEKLSQYEN